MYIPRRLLVRTLFLSVFWVTYIPVLPEFLDIFLGLDSTGSFITEFMILFLVGVFVSSTVVGYTVSKDSTDEGRLIVEPVLAYFITVLVYLLFGYYSGTFYLPMAISFILFVLLVAPVSSVGLVIGSGYGETAKWKRTGPAYIDEIFAFVVSAGLFLTVLVSGYYAGRDFGTDNQLYLYSIIVGSLLVALLLLVSVCRIHSEP
jgi:hypothetical protein